MVLTTKNLIKITVRNPEFSYDNDTDTLEKELKTYMSKGFNKLNVGGGSKNLSGFVNIDFVKHDTVEREIRANINDLTFVPDESIAHIHTNHVVEHLTCDELVAQLKEYFRILKPGGILSLRCPNALGVCYGFWFDVVPERNREEFVRLGFPPDEEFHNQADGWYHKDFHGLFHWLYADTGNPANEHKNILTPSMMKNYLIGAGFEVLKMTDPETSNIVVVATKHWGMV